MERRSILSERLPRTFHPLTGADNRENGLDEKARSVVSQRQDPLLKGCVELEGKVYVGGTLIKRRQTGKYLHTTHLNDDLSHIKIKINHV